MARTLRILGLLMPTLLVGGCGTAQAPPASEEARRERIDELWRDLEPILPDVPGVTPAELLGKGRSDSVVLVDVRTPEETEVSMIPGAITARELEENPERYRGREIVAYCTIGARSAEYAARLRRDGWNAGNLVGSVLVWTHEGGELVDSSGRPTRRVHVYGEDWNLVADDYEPVW